VGQLLWLLGTNCSRLSTLAVSNSSPASKALMHSHSHMWSHAHAQPSIVSCQDG